MPKTVYSKVAKFPGSVVLTDPLTLPQVLELEEGIDEHDALIDSGERSRAVLSKVLVPTLCKVIVECHLQGWPEHPSLDTWPASPRGATADVTDWLIEEVRQIYIGDAQTVPFESTEKPPSG